MNDAGVSANARSGRLALRFAGAALVLGASRLFFAEHRSPGEQHGSRPAQARARDDAQDDARDDVHAKRSDLRTYAVGYVLALALTGAAFALVHWRWASGATALGLVFGLALVQTLVHFRCFLHIDLKRAARDDLQLILFTALIVGLMVGGTLVVLFNLRMRMM